MSMNFGILEIRWSIDRIVLDNFQIRCFNLTCVTGANEYLEFL